MSTLNGTAAEDASSGQEQAAAVASQDDLKPILYGILSVFCVLGTVGKFLRSHCRVVLLCSLCKWLLLFLLFILALIICDFLSISTGIF